MSGSQMVQTLVFASVLGGIGVVWCLLNILRQRHRDGKLSAVSWVGLAALAFAGAMVVLAVLSSR